MVGRMARLTAVEKVKRDAQLVTDRSMGMTFPLVAAKHGLKERQAKDIYYAWRDSTIEDQLDEDAVALAFDYKTRYEAVESRLAEVAMSADNDSARVGALRALIVTTNQRLALDQALGKLPRNLGALRIELDVRHVSAVLVKILERYEIPEEGLREIARALQGDPALN